jgi:hypothetical protein
MARLRIIDSTGGSGPFSTGATNTTITIDLDEALPTEDFQNAVGTFVVAAQTIIRSLDGEDDTDDEPILPQMVVVPDDQVQAVADLNSGIDRPAGLLIIPASARRVNFPGEGADEAKDPNETPQHEWDDAPLPPKPEDPEERDSVRLDDSRDGERA